MDSKGDGSRAGIRDVNEPVSEGHAVTRWFRNRVHRMLPTDYAQRDLESQRQARTLVTFCPIGAPMMWVLALVNARNGNMTAAVVVACAAIIVGLTPWLVKLTCKVKLGIYVAMGASVGAATAVAVVAGGLNAAAFVLFPLFPMISLFVGGRTVGRFMTVVSLTAIAGLYLCHRLDLLPTSPDSEAKMLVMKVADGFFACLIVYFLGSQFTAIKDRLFDLVQKRNDQMLRANDELQTSMAEALAARVDAEEAHRKLAEADHQKTHFFQSVSHELRTPLTLILNPLEALFRRMPEQPEVEVAVRNSRRLLRLVNQLLEFQKLSAGKRELRLGRVEMLRFVRVCGDYFASACATKQVSFRVTLDGELVEDDLSGHEPVFIAGEVDALEKILFNYLSNALKYTPEHGGIELAVNREAAHLRVTVVDSGPGISSGDRKRLFRVFSQLENSAKIAQEGTGLGLALVHELAQCMKGEVGVDSEMGRGSRFWVRFPIMEGVAELEGNEPDTEDGLQTEARSADWLLADVRRASEPSPALEATLLDESDASLILVVDDLQDMRRLISSTLRTQGYRVIMARDADEGLRLARAQHPELVVTDWMMPGRSGLDLVGDLRSDSTLRSVPVVLLTARSDEEGKLLGTEVGADAFLGKPFSEPELCATVRNLLTLKSHEKEVEQLNREIRENVLKRYLPPDLVDAVLRGEHEVGSEPETLNVTVLFADLCGFTEATRRLRASKMAHVLNDYLAAMNHVVFSHGGTVDKFIGDAVMVIFGAPTDMRAAEQACRAARCAQDMQRAIRSQNKTWSKQGVPEMRMRVGIHHGPAVVGHFGSQERLEYTAIGHTVNVASRIESACAPGDIYVSGQVADLLPEDVVVEAGEHLLKGISGEQLLYSLPLDSALGNDKDEAAA